jgi:hypothetical protein
LSTQNISSRRCAHIIVRISFLLGIFKTYLLWDTYSRPCAQSSLFCLTKSCVFYQIQAASLHVIPPCEGCARKINTFHGRIAYIYLSVDMSALQLVVAWENQKSPAELVVSCKNSEKDYCVKSSLKNNLVDIGE